ncbi:MAG: AMP-binding protein [Muribaculaceae bacterium]|jgi:phenylacetate-CoA ligase|uniref:phenylacetate--CoA ligase family protein n=1 Tax=Bacteroidales TaxID=171549 RepID=UPI000E823F6B|nr:MULTISPECIES: AMP-binding protein [Bacteroidales]MBJ2192900.1 AMP-binding protein [Muribaculaceae bacterium]ROS85927.1 phenylacetate--CoA ligase family protein [Muribaculaceae bacterium Isolate-036 (Harlan)]ROT24753.1 phenylacetate--CoA ligase family protein [Muribaculaceae bacterium Isolate-114 (HZI)]ROT25387.1 phenylacetate--CoA ligase family protein [Muribaculaceae bacterium Isolate-113 (HZI)]RXE69758.1 phenylacetate--CoA ligase family protein [Muribaculaceae bacterium Isolate-001 (NCI)]
MKEDIEFRSPAEIEEYQNGRLREALRYLADNSPFYRRVFRDNGININDIRTTEDLVKIPFTEKKDLQLHNADFLCVPPEKIIDYITTSGTLGDPVTFGCTDKDLDRLAYNEMKSFSCAGVKPGNIVQLMTTLDKRFMAGLAYFLGIRKLGASVIRVGNGMPELQWDTINRLKPDTIMCVPSFILRLIEYAEMNGIDYRNSSIRRIIGIGEGLREQDFSLNLLGNRIKEKWDVDLFATYSSTEMGATFSECPFGCGGHVHPELIIVEIIGDNNLPVKDGEVGEVVITTLGVEGMPLLRFRTGDMSSKVTGECRCGRNSYRLTPLVGRKNNMIKLKGTTIYPPAINDVLDNTPYVINYVVEVRNSFAGTDEVVVKAGVASAQPFDMIKDLKDRFRSRIRVAPIVEILSPEDISKINNPGSNRKPVKFIDNRKTYASPL